MAGQQANTWRLHGEISSSDHFGEYGGFSRAGFRRRRRPWLFRHHRWPALAEGGLTRRTTTTTRSRSVRLRRRPLPFPLRLHLPLKRARRRPNGIRRRHHWHPDDQRRGDDEPVEARGEGRHVPGRRGRWVLRDGKPILYGVFLDSVAGAHPGALNPKRNR